jgi:dTDP-6-deoxy-L-talose 4-dehydrogenase (NAD+)
MELSSHGADCFIFTGRAKIRDALCLPFATRFRDFLDVQEAGKCIAKVVMGSHTGPLNICSGQPVTVRELAESIADEYGQRDLLKFGARAENPVDPPFVAGIPSTL